jgi:hypothetical protein
MIDDETRTQIAIRRQKDQALQAQAIQRQNVVASDTVRIGSRQPKSGLYTLTTNDGSTLVNGQKISNAELKPGDRVTPKQNGEIIAVDSKAALGKSRIRLISANSEASNKGAKYTGNQLKNQGYLNRQIFTFPKEDPQIDSILYLYTLEETPGIISYYVGGLKTGSKLIKTFNTSQYTIRWANVDNLGKKKYSVDFIYDYNNGINPVDRIAEHCHIDPVKSWFKSFLTNSPVTGANFKPTVVSKGYGFFRTIPFTIQRFPSGIDASYTANNRVIYAYKNTLKVDDYPSIDNRDIPIGGNTLSNSQKDYSIILPLNDIIDGFSFKVFDSFSTLNVDTSFFTLTETEIKTYRVDKKFTKAIGDFRTSTAFGGSSSVVNKFTTYNKLGNIATSQTDYAIDADLFGDFDLFNNKFTSIKRNVVYITNDTTEKPTIPVRLFDYNFKQTSVKKRKTNLPTIKHSSLIVVNYSYANQ